MSSTCDRNSHIALESSKQLSEGLTLRRCRHNSFLHTVRHVEAHPESGAWQSLEPKVGKRTSSCQLRRQPPSRWSTDLCILPDVSILCILEGGPTRQAPSPATWNIHRLILSHLRVVSTADATCSSNWAILWRNRGCTNVWQSSKSCVTVRWRTQWNEWELVTQMQPLHVQQRIVVVGAVTFALVNGNRRWRCRAANVTTLYAAVTVRKLPFVSNVRAQTICRRHSTDSSELRSDTPCETLTIWLFIIHLYDWHSYVHVIVFLLRKLLTHCKLCRRWKCGCSSLTIYSEELRTSTLRLCISLLVSVAFWVITTVVEYPASHRYVNTYVESRIPHEIEDNVMSPTCHLAY